MGGNSRGLGAMLAAALLVAAVFPLAGPAAAAGTFSDDDGNTHEANIEIIAAHGITKGCNPPANTLYCPDDPVTRAEMASFLVRALDLPPAGSSPLTDIAGNTHEDNINALYAAGVTKGCNPPANTLYCPDDPVTRAEMASFLVRALDLTNPNPTTTTTTNASTTTTNASTTTSTSSTTTTTTPGSAAWSTAPTDMPAAILDAGYAQIGSLLFVGGGKTSATTRVTSFRSYDMQTDTWDSTLTAVPGTAREDIAMAALNGDIYVFGGATTTFNLGDSTVAAVYDPATDTWDDAGVADLAAGRTGAKAIAWKGDIWIVGGFDSAGNSLDSVLIYDPGTNTYSDGPDLPAPRDTARTAIANDGSMDRLYVLGGRNSQGSPPLTKVNSWVLNASDNGWVDIDDLPTARRSFVPLTVDGKILVFGGENEGGVISTVDEYDPVADVWTTLTGNDWPTPRHGPVGGVATVSGDETVFLSGGAKNSGASGITAATDSFIRANVP